MTDGDAQTAPSDDLITLTTEHFPLRPLLLHKHQRDELSSHEAVSSISLPHSLDSCSLPQESVTAHDERLLNLANNLTIRIVELTWTIGSVNIETLSLAGPIFEWEKVVKLR